MQALVGREAETARLLSMVEESINEGCSLSCYISGRPGTGKTATVKLVTESLQREGKVDLCYINCAPVKTTNDLYKAIAARGMNRPSVIVRMLSTEVHKFFTSLKKHIVIVLDEVDHLCSRKQEVLYTAFRWPCDFKNIILLGIANSLDLTERLLPKLKLSSSPVSFIFPPYSTDNLVDILKKKLENEENVDPRSIELCAKKVALQTGDVRQAISIAEQMLTVMREVSVANTEVPETPKHSACKAVLSVMSSVQDSPLKRSNIPQHPKLILATMLGLMRDTKRSYVLRDRLFAAYRDGCSACQIPNSLDRTELAGALQMLEAQGIVRFDSANKVSLQERRAATRTKLGTDHCVQQIYDLNFCSISKLRMRPLTDEETEMVFKKLAHYIGENVRLLIERDDGTYCFRLHKERIYYCREDLLKKAALIAREPLLSFGTCLGKFTHSKKFHLHITALDYLAPYAKWRVWLKPNAEQQFLYGNNVLKSGVGRMTEGTESHQGVVVYSMSDMPLGFGVTAKSTTDCRRADPTAIVVLHQCDLGEYLRSEQTLT